MLEVIIVEGVEKHMFVQHATPHYFYIKNNIN